MGGTSASIEEVAWAYALLNAVKHSGRARVGPVMGKIMAARPELRGRARELVPIVKRVVEEVNKLTPEEQERLLREKYSWVLEEAERRRGEGEKKLPPLPGAEEGRVVTRFAPNPDFVIHLGNARPAILSHEYARMYKGRFILRFEDTDPRIKTPLPEAYDAIREDLRWLGVRWDEEYIQSLRMEVYYEYAEKLIRLGGAYVDDNPADVFRKYRGEGRLADYPPRRRSVEENLELWEGMLEGRYAEGEAVLRVKTDPNHPDPSIRDWVAFRIIDTSKHPHPLTGDRYIVWPTYNFAAGVDDHLLGVTHILRAREHRQNTMKQEYLYRHMGWDYPSVIHFGRLRLEGFIMSKSLMKSLASEEGEVRIDDPRFATIAGLRRRGIDAETIRRVILDVGVKQTDASISYTNLASLNRSIIDPRARRLVAVLDPVTMVIDGLPEPIDAEIPYHPSRPEMGSRRLRMEAPRATVYIQRADAENLKPGSIVRLLEAVNVEVTGWRRGILYARYHSRGVEEARKASAPIIQWLPAGTRTRLTLLKPEGLDMDVLKGLVEDNPAVKPGDVVQLMRIGFARIDAVVATRDRRHVRAIYAHD